MTFCNKGGGDRSLLSLAPLAPGFREHVRAREARNQRLQLALAPFGGGEQEEQQAKESFLMLPWVQG